MALPIAEKIWQFNVNVAPGDLGSLLANRRRGLRRLKNILIHDASEAAGWTDTAGGAISPASGFTVLGSSDSVAGGIDGVDRWDADSDLVWAADASPHSWMLLRKTTLQSNHQVLLSCEGASASGALLTVRVSPSAGFSGGSNTTNPTAADAITLLSNAAWDGGQTAANLPFVYHVMTSSDGQCNRIVIFKNNVEVAFVLLDRPKMPRTGWTNPSISAWASIATDQTALDYADFFGATARIQARYPAGNAAATLTAEGFNGQLLGETFGVANEIDSEWDLAPVAFACTVVGSRGRNGAVFDLWCASNVNANGTGYPGDASRQFMQMGDFVFRWNGSTLLTA